MTDDEVFAVLLVVLVFARRKESTVAEEIWGAGWVWPVPTLITTDGQSYDAVVSDGFQTSRATHVGLDIDYRRKSLTDRPEYAPGSRNGTTSYFAPPGTPILAAKDARVWSVAMTPRGWEVVLDHGRPWATFYSHLERAFLEPHANGKTTAGGKITHVKAGDKIGEMGWNPLDRQGFRHLHFEAWYQGGNSKSAKDPTRVMRTWKRETWRP